MGDAGSFLIGEGDKRELTKQVQHMFDFWGTCHFVHNMCAPEECDPESNTRKHMLGDVCKMEQPAMQLCYDRSQGWLDMDLGL